MSDERYVTIAESELRGKREDDVYMLVAHRWDKAEGQYIENIRWCTAHDTVIDSAGCGIAGHTYDACVIVEGTLILPPEAAS